MTYTGPLRGCERAVLLLRRLNHARLTTGHFSEATKRADAALQQLDQAAGWTRDMTTCRGIPLQHDRRHGSEGHPPRNPNWKLALEKANQALGSLSKPTRVRVPMKMVAVLRPELKDAKCYGDHCTAEASWAWLNGDRLSTWCNDHVPELP